MNILSIIIIPIFILIVFISALVKKINAYDVFISGAKSGINTVLSIFPLLLAMIFATSLLEASGIIDYILKDFDFFISRSIIMQSLIRPLSGNASLALMTDIYEKFGVDSKEALISSILQGSSDTTIYVCTLYFGHIGYKKYHKAIILGLICDLVGFFISLGIITLFII